MRVPICKETFGLLLGKGNKSNVYKAKEVKAALEDLEDWSVVEFTEWRAALMYLCRVGSESFHHEQMFEIGIHMATRGFAHEARQYFEAIARAADNLAESDLSSIRHANAAYFESCKMVEEALGVIDTTSQIEIETHPLEYH
ncbi:hypothetical protein [Roseibium alexandrii]|uniref:Uncharacterized protein n=1 Tax=Roseibium alexandrii (strain DSM 17067 / NCIMB 14079 / DFL-11) TaxID=244592 RepID=A0A5E8UWC0_ROSAD|nr:hypothetical protein [Roseibium alexandrii]RMX61847.1 hypothetical protein SADFL11_00036300 [Roseibium alexandrii DFL-11]